MVQSSMMSAVQFVFRLILGIRKLFAKKAPPPKREVKPPPPPTPFWTTRGSFVEYRGVSISLRPILPSRLETQPVVQQPEGTRLYLIWRDLVSPNYFQDLKRMLEAGAKREG